MEVPTLHQVLRCGHSAAAYQAGTTTTKRFYLRAVSRVGDLALSQKDTVITIANLSSAVAGMLWQATCMSLTVVWRSLRSAVSVLWFTAGAERSQQRYLGLAAFLPLAGQRAGAVAGVGAARGHAAPRALLCPQPARGLQRAAGPGANSS